MPRTNAARPAPASRPAGATAAAATRPGTTDRPAAARPPAARAAAASSAGRPATITSAAVPPTPPAAPVGAPQTFEAVVAKAAAKDKANIQRHLDALEAEGATIHVKMWKKLVLALAKLAPHSTEAVGKDAMRFYIADGRYRLQRYAIEDVRDGQIKIYLPDVLELALKKKVLAAAKVPGEYGVPGHAGEVVKIEQLDSDNTPEPAAHFKFMIGMGRKALRISMPAAGHAHQLAVAEQLCELAATPA